MSASNTAVSDRLRELGIELPAVAAPVAAYVPAVRVGDLVYTSGQLPFVDGDAADAKLAAEASALDALAAEVAARRRFQFASPSDRFLGEALGRLDAGLAALPALVDDVRARRAFAALSRLIPVATPRCRVSSA